MINFKNQIKTAKKTDNEFRSQMLLKHKCRRKTELTRIEAVRYCKLRNLAREEKKTLSRLMDEIIDNFLTKFNIGDIASK